MKIREIRVAGLRKPVPDRERSRRPRRDNCVYTLMAIITDEGLTGLGSVYTNDGLVRSALAVLEPLYRGENALEPERVSEKLHQHTFSLGRGGSITHTISGIDIALWDLLGKATGQPIGRLLGGRYRERVKPYASLSMTDPARLAHKLRELKERGFRAFKIGWGPFGRRSNALDEAIVRAAREAVGSDMPLMIDAGASGAFWKNGYKWALRTARMLAHYDVDWFEEPLKPDALHDYVLLRQNSPVDIAGGEVLTRRQTFLPWLQNGAFDIVQPDITKVGGISEARRIAWTAQNNGIRLIPHGWNTAVGLAADLQLASALPGTDLVEYLVDSPYIDEIAVGGWPLDEDGMLAISDAPGLGLELDMDAVERYTRGESLLH
jgi:D-galactarolactone cycloisomerase